MLIRSTLRANRHISVAELLVHIQKAFTAAFERVDEVLKDKWRLLLWHNAVEVLVDEPNFVLAAAADDLQNALRPDHTQAVIVMLMRILRPIVVCLHSGENVILHLKYRRRDGFHIAVAAVVCAILYRIDREHFLTRDHADHID